MTIENIDSNYKSALDLNLDPLSSVPDLNFLYEYESLEQSFAMLNNLVQSSEIIVLVIGQEGAGKTMLLTRYLKSSKAGWKASRIRIHPVAEKIQPDLFKEMDSYPAYVLNDSIDPIIIIDDAHTLDKQQVQFLLQNATSSDDSKNVKRFVLFGEPGLNEMLSDLADSLHTNIAISKIFLPPLTREETAGYLNYRLAVAGYVGKSAFPASAIKQIHRSSEGLPGRINALAAKWLKNKHSGGKKGFEIFRQIMDQPRTLGWVAAGCALVAMVLVGLYYYVAVSAPQPDIKRYQAKIIRKKIMPGGHLGQTLPAVSKTKALIKETRDSQPAEPVEEKTLQPDETLEEETIAFAQKPSPPPAPVSSPVNQSKAETVTDKKDIEAISAQELEAQENRIGAGKIHREKWLLTQSSAYYTIQILGVRNEKRLQNFVEENILSKEHNIAYYQTRYKDKDWYPLLYGVYATKAEASSAMKELPPTVQKASPWIRRMSSVHRAIQVQSTKKQN
jgi:type II secretory pathway predicted ATPase ExeA